MEIALGILVILVLVALAVLIALQIRKPAPAADNQSLGLLQNQLNSLQERLDKFGQTVSDTLQNSTASMNTRGNSNSVERCTRRKMRKGVALMVDECGFEAAFLKKDGHLTALGDSPQIHPPRRVTVCRPAPDRATGLEVCGVAGARRIWINCKSAPAIFWKKTGVTDRSSSDLQVTEP